MARKKKKPSAPAMASAPAAAPPAEPEGAGSAKEIVARAQAAVEELSTHGVDVSALAERLSAAIEKLTTGEYRAAEMAAGEILVLAKAMKEMAALSGDLATKEDTERATVVDAISTEVSRQVKEVTRDIPMEIGKQVREATKRLPMDLAAQVQENLSTYPTMDRVEEIASRRASQAAQDLLLSKEFEDKIAKLVASAVDRLPNLTRSDVSSLAKEETTASLKALLNSPKFKERVTDIAESSSKISEDEAKDLLEKSLRDRATKDDLKKAVADLARKEELQGALSDLLAGDEFAGKVKTIVSDLPKVTPDDVSGIASGIAAQAVKAAFASDEWTERVKSIADEALSRFGETIDQSISSLTEGLMKGTALDEKIRAISAEGVAEMEGRLPEFKEGIRRSVLEEVAPAVSAIIESEGFAERVGGLVEEKVRAAVEEAVRERLSAVEELKSTVGELKSHAPEDLLNETRKEARAEVASIVDSEAFLKVVTAAMKRAGPEALDEGKVAEIAKAQAEEVLSSNAPPLDEEKIVNLARGEIFKAFGWDEFKKVVAETAAGGAQEKIVEIVKESVAEKLGSGIDPAMLENILKQAAPTAVKEIANSDEFKKMLDGKFRVIMKFLKDDLVPKTVKKLVGG